MKIEPPLPPPTVIPVPDTPELDDQLNELQQSLDALYHDMRTTNVRSRSLKVSVHERWLECLQIISRKVAIIRGT